jgi:hypothetical protein
VANFCHLTSDSIFARAAKDDLTPAGEKFYEILRQLTGTSLCIANIKSED